MADSSAKLRAEGSRGRFPPQKKSPRSRAKRASDKERDKTRVNIGPAFPRWRALRAARGLQLDSDLALLLLDSCEKGPWSSPRLVVKHPAVPESSRFHDEEAELDEDRVNALENCVVEWSSSECDGSSGEASVEADGGSDEDRALQIRLRAVKDAWPKVDDLPVVVADETVHDVLEALGPEKMPPPTEPHTILTEEDIVGSRASVVYEESLRQLAALLRLPVKRCRYRMSTGLMCFGLPPFQCLIQHLRCRMGLSSRSRGLELDLAAHLQVRDAGRRLHAGDEHPAEREQLQQSGPPVPLHEHGGRQSGHLLQDPGQLLRGHHSGVLDGEAVRGGAAAAGKRRGGRRRREERLCRSLLIMDLSQAFIVKGRNRTRDTVLARSEQLMVSIVVVSGRVRGQSPARRPGLQLPPEPTAGADGRRQKDTQKAVQETHRTVERLHRQDPQDVRLHSGPPGQDCGKETVLGCGGGPLQGPSAQTTPGGHPLEQVLFYLQMYEK